jgi:hypothetical protein
MCCAFDGFDNKLYKVRGTSKLPGVFAEEFFFKET